MENTDTGLMVTFNNISEDIINELLVESDFYCYEVYPNVYLFPCNVSEYDNETSLVEGVVCSLDIPSSWVDDSVHWIWDEALIAFDQQEEL